MCSYFMFSLNHQPEKEFSSWNFDVFSTQKLSLFNVTWRNIIVSVQ